MRRSAVVLVGVLVSGCAVAHRSVAVVEPPAREQGDGETTVTLPVLATPERSGGDATEEQLPPRAPAPSSPWSLFTSIGNGLSSNINFDQENVGAYGAVLASGVRFAGDDLTFSYEAAGHSYTNTNRWNRVSHMIAASFETDLFGDWELETTGSAGFKGSSEDRDIVDQDFEISPMMSYEFTRQRRLRLFTVHRLKRYNDAPLTNAFKNYVGAEFRELMGERHYVEVGGRFETNDERIDRGDYRRWTYWVENAVPLTSRDALVTQLRYRLKKYTSRFVEVEDEDVLRVDHRWLPAVTWIRTLQPNLDLRVEYSYETNYSNNPEREYGAHMLWTSMAVRWCGGCWPFSR